MIECIVGTLYIQIEVLKSSLLLFHKRQCFKCKYLPYACSLIRMFKLKMQFSLYNYTCIYPINGYHANDCIILRIENCKKQYIA